MVGDLDSWMKTLEEPGLVEQATARIGQDRLALVSGLRKRWPGPLVSCAVELAEARRRATAKFPDEVASRLVADVVGVQMASSESIAAYKASRFRNAPGDRILDLCSGIGGDAMHLASVGPPCLAVDQDPVRAWMSGLNASCPSIEADATASDVRGALVHVDPSRRDEGSETRIFDLARCVPGPDDLARFASESEGCCFKLAPSISSMFGGELEIISEGRRVRQGLIWTGALRTCTRRATCIRGDEVLTFTGEEREFCETDNTPAAVVLEPDPALERASLLEAFALRHDVRLLPSSRLLNVPSVPDSLQQPPDAGWVTTFDVLDVVPWKEVEAAIDAHDGGEVEVKPRTRRDRGFDPDVLQVRLRGTGSRRLSLFIIEEGGSVHGVLTIRR